VQVADPGEASTAGRGKKRRDKTDRIDARALRELAEQGRVPDSWIPPFQVLEVRAKVRLASAPRFAGYIAPRRPCTGAVVRMTAP
jgi:hypothetical protein